MPGPHDYSAGTRAALFELAQGKCYYRDCDVEVITWLGGLPVINVEIAHVRGAEPKAARYDGSMTDAERASFDNVMLMCVPHHKLIDRVRPDDHPVELLLGWKFEREGAARTDLDVIQGLDPDAISELIESIVVAVSPSRSVVVDLEGGFLDAGRLTTVPLAGMHRLLEDNPILAAQQPVVVTTARNTGSLPVVVEVHGFDFFQGATPCGRLMGNNTFVENPILPFRVEVGDAFRWLTDPQTILHCIKVRPTELRARVDLASGELVVSDAVGLEELPLWKDPEAAAELLAQARSAVGEDPLRFTGSKRPPSPSPSRSHSD
jgi:hypothetical protein